MTRFDYSLVIPVYGSEACLVPLFRSLQAEVLPANPERRGELVFVDDGSEDGSLDVLRRLRAESPANVTIIKLTRNFGQASALLAGYEHARGSCVITISADGQEPSSLINEMLRWHFDEHYEVVIAARAGRDESLYRSLTSRWYFFLMRLFTNPKMPKGGFDSWLMGRRALAAFLRHSDETPSLQWRVLWLGYGAKVITYRRRARLAGRSQFTLAKRLDSVLVTLLGYSSIPIRAMMLTGCALSLLGLAYAVFVVAERLLLGRPIEGWGLVLILLLVLGGIQMTMLGVIGEYVWRTLQQVRGREPYLIDTIDRDGEP